MENKNIPIETEVKYLIDMPSIEGLLEIPSVRVKQIIQTYLFSPQGVTRRIRKLEECGTVKYILTEKIRISDLSALEDERIISEEEYNVLLLEADTGRTPIEKTRYAFDYKDHTIEIDVYPFWNDVAILEIELSSEGEEYYIPDFINVLKNVTSDKQYKNANLAKDHDFSHF